MSNSFFSDRQRDNSRNFIRELQIQQTLEHMDQNEPEFPEEIDSSGETLRLDPPRPFDSDIYVGDVRLLSQTPCLQYVLVLAQFSWANWLVVPFSDFRAPATDSEFQLAESGGLFLETLQLWNARTINRILLQKSWHVTRLSAKVLGEVRAVHSHYLLGENLPSELSDRTGVPIYRENDPRLDYQTKALERFAALDAADFHLMELAESLDEQNSVLQFPEWDLRAAAGKESLSQVYRSDLSAEGMLAALVDGRIPGNLDSPAELIGDFPQTAAGMPLPELEWQGDIAIPEGASVLFWHKPTQMLLGIGATGPEGQLLLRASAPHSPAIESVHDIIIFVGC